MTEQHRDRDPIAALGHPGTYLSTWSSSARSWCAMSCNATVATSSFVTLPARNWLSRVSATPGANRPETAKEFAPPAVRTPIAAPGALHADRYRSASTASARCGTFADSFGGPVFDVTVRGGVAVVDRARRGDDHDGRDVTSRRCSHQTEGLTSAPTPVRLRPHVHRHRRLPAGRVAVAMTRPPRDRFERESRREHPA